MRVLAIDDQVRDKIARAIQRAERKPITLELLRKYAVTVDKSVMTLEQRKQAEPVVRPQSEHVLIPFGYRAALSIEEQEAGFAKHLSISVDTVGRSPNEPAFLMIAKEFGIEPPFDKMWLEEFDPGHYAVNILKVYKPRDEGNA